MKNILAWRTFFLSIGLFFTGLSVGILGSTTEAQARYSAFILLIVGVSSLVLGLILWALQIQKQKNQLSPQTLANLRTIELKRAFDSLLQSSSVISLFRGENFTTEARILLNELEIICSPHKQYVIHHCFGIPFELRAGTKIFRLESQSMLRLPAQSMEYKLNFVPIEPKDDELESVMDSRASQFLFYTIEESLPS